MMDGNDFIEVGESGLIPQANGWWLDKNTGNRISPDGKVLNAEGEEIAMVHYDDDDTE